jgi:hypothetical protein
LHLIHLRRSYCTASGAATRRAWTRIQSKPSINAAICAADSLMPTFVPVVSVESAQAKKAAHERRPSFIEIVMGAIKVRVSGGIDTRDIEAVLRAVRRLNA